METKRLHFPTNHANWLSLFFAATLRTPETRIGMGLRYGDTDWGSYGDTDWRQVGKSYDE